MPIVYSYNKSSLQTVKQRWIKVGNDSLDGGFKHGTKPNQRALAELDRSLRLLNMVPKPLWTGSYSVYGSLVM